jgi:Tol biopolymer transport system component
VLSERAKRLALGSWIGTFRIDALLGVGGMGEVYRAHDTRLGRAVAIKVLPEALAHDVDRRARFAQEARALAALNHPHIGAIYGVEESGDVAALVLELVEGPTLAERLLAGPMPIAEVETVAHEIAMALETAHDRGIVHRDLKPANIKITADSGVKVLDFGLAKAIDPPAAADDDAPTRAQHTGVGVIVGTAGYMSPEQARGQNVDKRTDIWAFGCLLFEMCAGRPPFTRDTVTDTLAAVIEREPDWTRVTSRTPRYLIRLLRRCLTKDPKQRLRDIGEARIALAGERDDEPATVPLRRRWRAATIAVVGLLAAASAIAIARYGPSIDRRPATSSPVRFQVPPPDGTVFNRHPARTFFALSPDGSQLAFITEGEGTRVWLRAVASLDARPVPGTEGATYVFWSPDGRSLAFFADGKLKRVDLPDGAVVPICDVSAAFTSHGTWGRSGIILFSMGNGPAIYRVSAAGGAPTELLTPDPANEEVRVHWPSFLPDGQRFLYTARRTDGEGQLKIGDLAGGTRGLMPASSNAQWVDPDVVVFVREGVLMGQRIDLDAVRPVGDPFTLADEIDYIFTTSRGVYSTSFSGTIAYHADTDLSQLVWFDQRGNEVATIGSPDGYQEESVWLSPDGRVLLTAKRQPGLGTFDVWRHDLVRRTEERLTTDRAVEITPILADGDQTLVYAADRGGAVPTVFSKDLITGKEEALLPNGPQRLVMDLIPGTRDIVYVERSAQGGFEIFRLSLGGGSPDRVLAGRQNAFQARVSADGHAIAFIQADARGTAVYVAPLRATGAPVLVATDVSPPRWSVDGRHLYFLGRDGRMMAVGVKTTPLLVVGTPEPLFELNRPAILGDVSHDGRFLMLVTQLRAAERPIVVATAAIGPERP